VLSGGAEGADGKGPMLQALAAMLCGLVSPLARPYPASLPRGLAPLRSRPCAASLVQAAPLTTLPPGAANAALEQTLLRVLTAEETFAAPPAAPNKQGKAAARKPRQQSAAFSSGPRSIFGAAAPAEDDLVGLGRALAGAGFVLVGEREAALAAALQPTAVERLNVRPQLEQCDPSLAEEMGLARRLRPMQDASEGDATGLAEQIGMVGQRTLDGVESAGGGAGLERARRRRGIDGLRRYFGGALSRKNSKQNSSSAADKPLPTHPATRGATTAAQLSTATSSYPPGYPSAPHAPAAMLDPSIPPSTARLDLFASPPIVELPLAEGLLYGGRVIIWRRDYGSEVRRIQRQKRKYVLGVGQSGRK
jgi:hypothetical protein